MRGVSGRIVVEIDPALKRRLHSKLAGEGKNLKEWFLNRVDAYLADDYAVQLSLTSVTQEAKPRKKRRS